jgi:hypothetical protein
MQMLCPEKQLPVQYGSIQIPGQDLARARRASGNAAARGGGCSWDDALMNDSSGNSLMSKLSRTLANGNRRSSSLSGLQQFSLMQNKVAGVDPSASTSAAVLEGQLGQLNGQLHQHTLLEQAMARRVSAHF